MSSGIIERIRRAVVRFQLVRGYKPDCVTVNPVDAIGLPFLEELRVAVDPRVSPGNCWVSVPEVCA